MEANQPLSLLKRTLIIVALFSILILIHLFIDKKLYDASISVVNDFSKAWEGSFMKFMTYFTNIGTGIFVILSSMYVILSGPKIKQIMYLNAVLISWCIACFLKNLFNELRPYWTDINLKILAPESDYGNPSGHSISTCCITFSAMVIYLRDNSDFCLNEKEAKLISNSRTGIIYSPIVKTILIILSIILCIFIMFSRVYVGAHAFNQILQGFLLAMLCTYAIFFSFRKELISLYKQILKNNKAGVLYAVLSFIIICVCILSHIVLYCSLRIAGICLDEVTLKHIINYKKNFTKYTPLESSATNGCLVSALLGIHFGIFFSVRYMKINPTRISLPVSNIKKVLRTGLVILVSAPILAVPFILVPKEPFIALVWVKSVIPGLLMGFIIYGLGDFLMAKIGCLPDVADYDQLLGQPKL